MKLGRLFVKLCDYFVRLPWGLLFWAYLLLMATSIAFILYNFWLSSAVFIKFFGYLLNTQPVLSPPVLPNQNLNPSHTHHDEPQDYNVWKQGELEKIVSVGLSNMTQILEDYLGVEMEYLDNLEDFLKTLEAPDTKNPLSSFKLIKFLQSDTQAFINNLQLHEQNKNLLIDQLEELKSSSRFPSQKEMIGGGRAISRIQDIYGLDTNHLATGRLNGHCCAPNFTAEDSFEMVRIEYKEMRNYHQAIKWLDQAEKILTTSTTTTTTTTGQKLGFLTEKKKFLQDSIHEVRSIINKKIENQNQEPDTTEVEILRKYRSLCQGQSEGQGQLMYSSDSSSGLKCELFHGPGYGDLLRGPSKVEEIHKDSIFISHGLLSLYEIENSHKLVKDSDRFGDLDYDYMKGYDSSWSDHYQGPGGAEDPLKPSYLKLKEVTEDGWLGSLVLNEAEAGGFFVFPTLDLILPTLPKGSTLFSKIPGLDLFECPVIRGTSQVAQFFVPKSELLRLKKIKKNQK